MSKAIPPPTYLAPTLGDEDLEELSEEFFTDPFAVMKCKLISNLENRIIEYYANLINLHGVLILLKLMLF